MHNARFALTGGVLTKIISIMNDEPNYALVHFSLKYRVPLLVGAALLPLAMIALIAWPAVTATMLVAGVVGGAVAVFCMQLFIEIIGVIAETLLPR